MKKIMILAALATASATAVAQPTFGQAANPNDRLLYGELGYSVIELESDTLPGYSSDNDAVTGIIGYKFHPNISGEVFLAGGTGTENVNFGGVNVGSKIKNSYGLFIKPNIMVTDRLELFGRVGYLESELELSVPGAAASDSDGSFAYGAGVNYHFTDRFYGQAAYTSFYDKDDDTARGYTLAVGMKF